MNDSDGPGIPAASIGDLDLTVLARTNPDAAREIARLDHLMRQGEETPDQFLELCQLMFDVGAVDDSEYLLRRNLDTADGKKLYRRLFGTEKPDEFVTAVDAFKSQFGVELKFVQEIEFLFCKYHLRGGTQQPDHTQILARSCDINFGYLAPDTVEAEVESLDPGYEVAGDDSFLLMYFVNGVWEIADLEDE